MSDEILLKNFRDRQEAEIAHGLLVSRGIEAFISSDACGQEYPNLEYVGGVQLMIAEESLDEARRILAEAGQAGKDAEGLEAEAIEAADGKGRVAEQQGQSGGKEE